jgi:type III pantothenate kinase
MLLVVDVGNTNMCFGVYRGTDLVHAFRLTTRADRTSDEMAVAVLAGLGLGRIEPGQIDALIIGSVVPPLRRALVELCADHLKVTPLWVEPGIKTGMPILSENPQEVGADRITNGVAAYTRFGGPVVVVDLGTATTFDVISAAGEYIGGVIAPGVQISSEALFARAARLPKVGIERPTRVIGRNTVQCMQSGLYYGYVGLVEGILARIAEELGTRPRVVATGGLAALIARDATSLERIEPNLTLEGLRLLHERNPR